MAVAIALCCAPHLGAHAPARDPLHEIPLVIDGITNAVVPGMLRDEKSVPSRAPVSPVPPAPSTRVASVPSSRGSAPHQAPLTLFDPYSQQMIVCSPGTVHAAPAPAPASSGEATGSSSKVLLVVQIALLASVAVMVLFMLSILRTTA